MLVLTRKLMEKLFIGDDICVTVVRLEGGQVRLGIEAPREISVVRAELVPERAAAAQRAPHRAPAGPPPATSPANGAADPAHAPVHGGPAREAFRVPQASAHGIGNRRRGRSR